MTILFISRRWTGDTVSTASRSAARNAERRFDLASEQPEEFTKVRSRYQRLAASGQLHFATAKYPARNCRRTDCGSAIACRR